MYNYKSDIIFISILLAIICGGGYIIIAAGAQLSFPAEAQKVETVRTSLAEVASGDRGELIREAVKWNQKIVACRYWNTKWYADLAFHDGCNDLPLIAIK